MSNEYEKVRDVWEFEKFLSSKPDVWLNEAYNLRLACKALLLYDDDVTVSIFDKKEQPRLSAFFSARIERMLMGFALENLIKAILLQDPDKFRTVFSKEGRLSWGNGGHDLLVLLELGRVPLSPEESFFVEAWQTCAIWAGRYPIPKNEHDLPKHRKAMRSSDALTKRAIKRFQKALEEGHPMPGMELHDLLHVSVGNLEEKTFDALFARCLGMLPSTRRQ